MTYFCEAGGQDVHKKTPYKLLGMQAHFFKAAAVPIITPLKANRIIFNLENTVVGNGYPMGVASEIFNDTCGIFKRRLAIHYPLLLVTDIQQILRKLRHLKF